MGDHIHRVVNGVCRRGKERLNDSAWAGVCQPGCRYMFKGLQGLIQQHLCNPQLIWHNLISNDILQHHTFSPTRLCFPRSPSDVPASKLKLHYLNMSIIRVDPEFSQETVMTVFGRHFVTKPIHLFSFITATVTQFSLPTHFPAPEPVWAARSDPRESSLVFGCGLSSSP